MGLRSFLFGSDEESEEIGRNWAERVIEQTGDGPICTNPAVPEMTPELVYELGKEYSANAVSFYNGFTETWNEHVESVGGDTAEEASPWWKFW